MLGGRVFVEAAGELPADERQRLQDWKLSRRHCADDVPWRTLAAARGEVARIRQQALVDLPLPARLTGCGRTARAPRRYRTVGSEHRSPPTPRRCAQRARRSRRSASSILGRSSSRAVLPPEAAATPETSIIIHRSGSQLVPGVRIDLLNRHLPLDTRNNVAQISLAKTLLSATAKTQKRPIPRTLREPYDPAAVRCFVRARVAENRWPRNVGPMPCWGDSAFRARYKPHIRCAVRIFACDGQSALAATCSADYKISTTCDVSERCDGRLAQLNRDRYGATIRDGVNWSIEEGWSRWMMSHCPDIAGLSSAQPCHAHERGLDILLPRELSPMPSTSSSRLNLAAPASTCSSTAQMVAIHWPPLDLIGPASKRFTSYIRRPRSSEALSRDRTGHLQTMTPCKPPHWRDRACRPRCQS